MRVQKRAFRNNTFGVGTGFARGRTDSSFAGRLANGPIFAEEVVGSTNSVVGASSINYSLYYSVLSSRTQACDINIKQ